MTESTITTRVDPLAEMRKAIDAAISEAEKAGVKPAAMVGYFTGCLNYAHRRALHVADQANATRPMSDGRGGTIDYAANAARAAAIREEKQRLADETAYRADLDRRAEAQAERESYIR
jgi:hypothetical protein